MGASGIDVSKWQGNIDWARVKTAGIKFAIAKATEGARIRDEKFLQNWEGMKKNGIKPAAYHYLRGDIAASEQVSNIQEVLYMCGFDKNNDVLAIDVEESRNENVSPEKMAKTLKEITVELKKNFKNIYIYCSPFYWEDKVAWKEYDFSVFNLWIADWSGKENPRIPTTWKNKGWTWWQISSKGNVDGITGFVDLDKSNPKLSFD